MSVLAATPLKVVPPAATGLALTPGTIPTWGAWVELVATTAAPIAVAGVSLNAGTYSTTHYELDVGIGAAGAEVSIGTLRLYLHNNVVISVPTGVLLPVPLGGIGSGQRVALRARSTGGIGPATVAISYYESLVSDQVTTSSQVLSSAPSGSTTVNITPSGTAWADSAWVELITSAAANLGLLGLVHGVVTLADGGVEYDLGTGASGAETVITTLRDQSATSRMPYTWLPGIYPVAAGSRVAVRMRKAGTNVTAHPVALLYYTNVSATPVAVATAQGYVWGPI